MLRDPIVWEAAALSALCLADMGSTIWLVKSGLAVEANPIVGFYMSHGTWVFAAAKVFMLVGPLIVLEWVRQKKPLFVRNMMRAGLVLYMLVYTGGILTLNTAHAQRRIAHANRIRSLHANSIG